MAAFSTLVIEGRSTVDRRLADWGLTLEQFVAIADVARAWADDAGPLMPLNAPGTLAYIYGVNELRRQLVGGHWVVDRTCGIEAVVNREIGIRIGYQNVDLACDPVFGPTPRSAKGTASESLCGPNLFEYSGIEVGPLTGVKQDGIPTYYVMVGEDGRVELSHPVIKDGCYRHFHERIFISDPAGDWTDEIDPATGPINDFEVAVSFKAGM